MSPAFANEPSTSLPLPAGATVQQAIDSPVCGKPAHMIIYDVPNSATIPNYVAYFKHKLPDAHYIHATWMNRPQELFFSADGRRSVSITGMQKGSAVYALSYAKFASPLSTRQEDAFSPNNSNCT